MIAEVESSFVVTLQSVNLSRGSFSISDWRLKTTWFELILIFCSGSQYQEKTSSFIHTVAAKCRPEECRDISLFFHNFTISFCSSKRNKALCLMLKILFKTARKELDYYCICLYVIVVCLTCVVCILRLNLKKFSQLLCICFKFYTISY